MFEKFYQKATTKYAEALKGLFNELQSDFNELWEKALKELKQTQLLLKEENKRLQLERETKEKEIIKVSAELDEIKNIKDNLQKEVGNLKKIKEKIEDRMLLAESKEEELTKKEQELDQREKKLTQKEKEIEMSKSILEEKEKSLKRVWEEMK